MFNKDKHIDVFMDEAYELCSQIESAMLDLERQPGSAEAVGSAFRAMHTLKGSAAMFGFEGIVNVAHKAENALDLVRNGKLAVGGGLVSASLASNDLIRSMLNKYAAEGNMEGIDATDVGKALDALIADIAGESKPAESKHAESDAQRPLCTGGPRRYRISFTPPADIYVRGMDPMSMIDELCSLGECESVVDIADLPALGEMDPDRCYTRWQLTLITACDERAIKDVFIFIEDECELTIEPMDHAQQAATGRQQATPANGSGAAASSTIRVKSEKLDKLVDLAGEVVTLQAGLNQLATLWSSYDMFSDRDKMISISAGEILDFVSMSEKLDVMVADLRESIMSIRAVQIGTTFDKFRRLVRDLSKELGKDMALITEGGEVELDKQLVDKLTDPIVHIIRNSADHGIESASQRLAAGKPATGTVRMSAKHAGDKVVISISDDGHGLDAQAIRHKAEQTGLIKDGEQMQERDIQRLIMEPGFSTAEHVTNVSGRGVGMDVVKRSIEALKGTVAISSVQGQGTTITMQLPLTLAIIDGLLVRVGTSMFAIPLREVFESTDLQTEQTRDDDGRGLIRLRGTLVPYISLRDALEVEGEPPAFQHVVVVHGAGGLVGLAVDEIIGEHQTVIKSLGSLHKNIDFVSGATILGNGTVALILDPGKLIEQAELEQKVYSLET